MALAQAEQAQGQSLIAGIDEYAKPVGEAQRDRVAQGIGRHGADRDAALDAVENGVEQFIVLRFRQFLEDPALEVFELLPVARVEDRAG
ncbi:hypothetical protein GCM10022261_01140 [Brevibacterium daeguense]|uniref:Uncharacterized protein n=1 Tax=Brevibacterium daeguense TaxID=909936 RepID=A0ABP8EF22_9MICO